MEVTLEALRQKIFLPLELMVVFLILMVFSDSKMSIYLVGTDVEIPWFHKPSKKDTCSTFSLSLMDSAPLKAITWECMWYFLADSTSGMKSPSPLLRQDRW